MVPGLTSLARVPGASVVNTMNRFKPNNSTMKRFKPTRQSLKIKVET